jgi:hypothetical protein
LTAGTIYYVRVRAVSSSGLESANSSSLTQSTVPVAPNAPTISSVTAATFTATWNSVAGASEYRIDVATTSDFTSGFVTNYNNRLVSGTSISVIGLSSGITYYVRVRVVNTLTANIVTSTNSLTATQITLPLAPNILTATGITNTSFTVNWNSVIGASSYRLDLSVNSNFTTFVNNYNNLIVNNTNQFITGLIDNTTYYIRVRSMNSAGVSINSPILEQLTNTSILFGDGPHFSNDSGDDNFGYTVATNSDGTVLIMGGPDDNESSFLGGAAIIYTGNSTTKWRKQQKLLPLDSVIDGASISSYTAHYGRSLATNNDGSIIVLGGPDAKVNGNARGVAAVFVKNDSNQWGFRQILTGNISSQFGYGGFGTSVAINLDGTVIAMGGPYDSEGGYIAGATVIYTGNSQAGWVLKQKILGSLPRNEAGESRSEGGFLGSSVVINDAGTILTIGAPYDYVRSGDTNSFFQRNGVTFIYTGNSQAGWALKQRIVGDTLDGAFGGALATNNDSTILAINTRNADPSFGGVCTFNTNCDIAFCVYTGNLTNGWNLCQKITGYSNLGIQSPNLLTLTMNGNGTVIGVEDNLRAFLFTGNPTSKWTLKNTLSGYSSIGGIATNQNGDILMVGESASSGKAFVYTL